MDPTSTERWELLVKECPQIAKHISGSIMKMLELSTLDNKTAQLVYIAVMASLDYPPAMRYHVTMALEAGASRDEIVGAASIAAAAAGPKGFVNCFPTIMEEIQKGEDA